METESGGDSPGLPPPPPGGGGRPGLLTPGEVGIGVTHLFWDLVSKLSDLIRVYKQKIFTFETG